MSEVKQESLVELELTRALTELSKHQVGTDGYAQTMKMVTELHKMKESEKSEPDRISKETMLVVGANLLGIVMVLYHERANVITSRAMTMLPKPKQV
jgi:hypothetical protein